MTRNECFPPQKKIVRRIHENERKDFSYYFPLEKQIKRGVSVQNKANHFYLTKIQDFRRRGNDRNRSGSDRRGSYQANDRMGSSNRHRSRSGNSDRDKMPPPKAPRNNNNNNAPRRGGMDRRRPLGGGIRRDTKMSLVHKRLAEKHGRRDRAREIINKRIKMAKMRR